MDFVEKNMESFHAFLKAKGYILSTNSNQDFTEGELMKLGRSIKNNLIDLKNKNPKLKI